MTTTYDYIIIGAGSAGGTLAARLTADPSKSVLLIEAGGSHKHPYISMPSGFAVSMYNERFSWCYKSEPERWANNRQILLPRGRVLGGSSSINGLLYIRGHRLDYDHWVEQGATGWGWSDVLPYFLSTEDQHNIEHPTHGKGGELTASDLSHLHPLTKLMVDSAVQNGVPLRRDFNDGEFEGAGFLQANITNGKRTSIATNALEPAMKRPNLHVVTQANVMQLLLDGRTATGVRYRQGDQVTDAHARAEVLVCGGAINSPQILMLSGIGPADHLQAMGINVAHHLPGVGSRMQDHTITPMTWRLKPGHTSYNEALQGLGLVGSVLRYFLARKGPLAMPAAEFNAYFKSDPSLPYADIQAVGLPVTGDIETAISGNSKAALKPEEFPGYTIAPCHVRPYSRGTVRLKSADPLAHPAIHFNYFDDERDRTAVISALRWLRAMAKQPALAAVTDAETRPGPATDTDADWLDYIGRSVTTGHHPTSTCSMGQASNPMTVVTPDLKVVGIDRLRVVDASVMPSVISGNTNAPSVMIGAKAADLILGRTLTR